MRTRLLLLLGITAVGGYAAYRTILLPEWRGWGVDPLDVGRELPGDDLVTDPVVVDTRGIDIDAPPEVVWPWLVQMGYGRGGWYSYDAVDMRGRSATAILPEHQSLAVGDIVPTDPDGGFLVKAIEPGQSLVLYLDTELARARAAKARHGAEDESTPANLAAAGAFSEVALPAAFQASWAFTVLPRDGGSRLVERLRVSLQGGGAGARIAGPAFGFGVFMMVRRQMLGIRERAERMARAEPAPAPATGGPTSAEPATAEALPVG